MKTIMPIVKDALRYLDRSKTAKTSDTRSKNRIRYERTLAVMSAAALRQLKSLSRE